MGGLLELQSLPSAGEEIEREKQTAREGLDVSDCMY